MTLWEISQPWLIITFVIDDVTDVVIDVMDVDDVDVLDNVDIGSAVVNDDADITNLTILSFWMS